MKRILVIEDSATQAAAVRASLESAGFVVDVAPGGESGLELCRASVPDLVLTDVVMPDLDGYAVTRALREDARTARVPIIVMTTLEDPAHVLEAVRAGADNYITKPLALDVVLPRIRRAMAGAGDVPNVELIRPALADVLVSCLEDAAARHRALQAKQAELERTNAQREHAMRIVAHELRGPLQAISMRAAAAKAMGGAGPLVASLPGAIQDTVGTMVRIIDDLTDLTDLDLGRMTLDRAPVALTELAARLVGEFDGMYTHRTFILEPFSGDSAVVADAARIEQVVRNFLTNAVKYTHGSVVVRLFDEGQVLRLAVVDEGPGLDASVRAQVFERYARVESGHDKPRGAGLGLYICRQIVALHGGTVGVESSREAGSSFFLRLPR